MSKSGSPPANLMDRMAVEAGGLGIEIVDVAGSIDELSESMRRQAEAFADMQESAGETARSQRCGDITFDDESTSGGVDEQAAVFEGGEAFGAEVAASGWEHWKMHRDDVRL